LKRNEHKEKRFCHSHSNEKQISNVKILCCEWTFEGSVRGSERKNLLSHSKATEKYVRKNLSFSVDIYTHTYTLFYFIFCNDERKIFSGIKLLQFNFVSACLCLCVLRRKVFFLFISLSIASINISTENIDINISNLVEGKQKITFLCGN
jgi:hypothetical protein